MMLRCEAVRRTRKAFAVPRFFILHMRRTNATLVLSIIGEVHFCRFLSPALYLNFSLVKDCLVAILFFYTIDIAA